MDIQSGAFKSYAWYCALLCFKMFIMSLLTAAYRIKNKSFANPEDAVSDKRAKVTTSDPDVERVRRAHQNDIENIVPFFILGFLYCCTGPDAWTANILFKAFTVARYLHTFVYAVVVVRQPARFLAWGVAYGVNMWLTWKVFCHFY